MTAETKSTDSRSADALGSETKRAETTNTANKSYSATSSTNLPTRDSERGSGHGERGTEKRSHLGTIIFILFALILLIAIIWFWRNEEAKHKKKPAPAKITITTATAEKGNIGVYLDEIGTVTPVYTSNITSEVTGLVMSVHFKEGQIVHKGEPLIDIDARPYRANLLQAQGALERDENILAEAEMDLERYREAWARNGIPKQQLDDQEKIVLQDRGTVKNDQGQVQYDEVQVEFCHITSPIDGRVGLRLVDPGNVVQADGTVTLAVITQLSPITVVFTIPEDNLGPVVGRLKKNAKLPVDAYDRTAATKIGTGNLLTVDNQIDTTTGTVKARAIFPNNDDALFPNQFVNNRLLVNTLQGVTLVPASTVQQNGQQSFVYVIENNVAHMRMVKTGVTDGGKTQVDGVNEGEVLANSSFDKLQNNSQIIVAQPTHQNQNQNQNENQNQNQNKGQGNPAASGSSAQ